MYPLLQQMQNEYKRTHLKLNIVERVQCSWVHFHTKTVCIENHVKEL